MKKQFKRILFISKKNYLKKFNYRLVCDVVYLFVYSFFSLFCLFFEFYLLPVITCSEVKRIKRGKRWNDLQHFEIFGNVLKSFWPLQHVTTCFYPFLHVTKSYLSYNNRITNTTIPLGILR